MSDDLLLPVVSHHCRITHSACDCVMQRLKKLEAVAEAARSVLSEEGVDESLCAYNMGCELILRLQALDAKRAPSSDQTTAKSNGKEGT